MKQTKPNLNFPKRFLWGAATAAHQVEGGNHNQWTEWELENAKTRATQSPHTLDDLPTWDEIKLQATNPDNYVSGSLADHYSNYKQDFDFLTNMHMNAYRFSIEWSRIEPEEGRWDAAAITHYKNYIAELKRRDIEPVITLFHFSLPVWFVQKGGFAKRSNVKYFVRYAEKVMRELGTKVKFVITINEPEVYATESYWHANWPPAVRSKWQWWRVVNNMMHAHNQAAKVIHSLNRRYKVSIAKNSVFVYPGDDAWLTRASAAVMQYLQDDYFIKKAIKSSDFIGVNYYFSNRVYGYRTHNPNQRLSDVGWDMAPENIEYALERLWRKYKKPILITENGLADANDDSRQWWITKTIAAMSRAMENEVELIGYLHWSLIDNFEWALGKWPRFGLIEVDYETGRRTLRPSAKWFGRVIKHLREE